jgi:hypothetical protein
MTTVGVKRSMDCKIFRQPVSNRQLFIDFLCVSVVKSSGLITQCPGRLVKGKAQQPAQSEEAKGAKLNLINST